VPICEWPPLAACAALFLLLVPTASCLIMELALLVLLPVQLLWLAPSPSTASLIRCRLQMKVYPSGQPEVYPSGQPEVYPSGQPGQTLPRTTLRYLTRLPTFPCCDHSQTNIVYTKGTIGFGPPFNEAVSSRVIARSHVVSIQHHPNALYHSCASATPERTIEHPATCTHAVFSVWA
jgi:hypothetical protein